MDHAESKDGSQIRIERTGDGPPIVLVPGALSDRSSSAPLVAELSRSMTVIRYDRRGRGMRFAVPPGTLDEEIDDLRAIADLVGNDMAIYGHSSGGTISLEAVLAGCPCQRLVLYEPPYIADPHDRARPPADLAALLRTRLESTGGADAALRAFLRLGPGLPPDAIERLAESELWDRLLRLAGTLPAEATIVGQGEIRTRASNSSTCRHSSSREARAPLGFEMPCPFSRALCRTVTRSFSTASIMVGHGQTLVESPTPS